MNIDGSTVALLGLIAAIVSAGTGFVTFWMMRGKAEANALSTAKSALEKAESAMNKADAINFLITEHRVETAGRIAELRATVSTVTKALAEAEMRLANAIEKMGERFELVASGMAERFEHVTERLDKVVQDMARIGIK